MAVCGTALSLLPAGIEPPSIASLHLLKNQTSLTMIRTRLLLASLLAMSTVSCTFHRADLWYPTVAEADAMDVQWGMEKRKPRGGPKQFYQYKSSDMAAMNLPAAGAAAPQMAPAPAPAPVTSPAAPSAPIADPSVQNRVNSLR